MRKKASQIILIFYLSLSQLLLGQSTVIQGELNKNCGIDKIYLYENIGGKFNPIDSCRIDQNNQYHFNGSFETGYYSIFSSTNDWVQFIINNKDTLISIDFPNEKLRDSIVVENSAENIRLWDFINKRRYFKSKISEAYTQKTYHQQNSTEYNFYSKSEDSLKNLLNNFILATYRFDSTSFLSRTIISDYEQLPGDDFFKYTFFTDDELIRSGVLSLKITQYLQFHTEYTEAGFTKSIDLILSKASENQLVYEFVLNYLLDLFNNVGPDIILDYLVNTYVLENSCSELDISTVISNKLESYRSIQIGEKLPQFSLFDESGTLNNINDLISLSNYNLLFFGSSNCAFCQEANPVLREISDLNDVFFFKVIYISLDTELSDILKTKASFGHNWIVLSELNSWDSKLAQHFMIHKTPSFILLDNNGIIIDKPKNMESLLNQLNFLKIKKPAK